MSALASLVGSPGLSLSLPVNLLRPEKKLWRELWRGAQGCTRPAPRRPPQGSRERRALLSLLSGGGSAGAGSLAACLMSQQLQIALQSCRSMAPRSHPCIFIFLSVAFVFKSFSCFPRTAAVGAGTQWDALDSLVLQPQLWRAKEHLCPGLHGLQALGLGFAAHADTPSSSPSPVPTRSIQTIQKTNICGASRHHPNTCSIQNQLQNIAFQLIFPCNGTLGKHLLHPGLTHCC